MIELSEIRLSSRSPTTTVRSLAVCTTTVRTEILCFTASHYHIPSLFTNFRILRGEDLLKISIFAVLYIEG